MQHFRQTLACSLFFFALGTTVLAASPDPPTVISPPDAAGQVPAGAALCAQVSDLDEDSLNVTFFGREITGEPAEDFTIIAVPDSQFYTQNAYEMFHSQTSWIVEQRVARNIVFVSHVGDVVHLGDSELEWNVAVEAMSRLEDPATTLLEDGIPYGISVGNHDQYATGQAGSLAWQSSTTGLYNQHFGVSRFQGRAYYGGHFGTNNDNSFQLFSAGGMDFIIIHLEYDVEPPASDLRGPVLAWADALLKSHPDRRAIITSHHLLCETTYCPGASEDPWAEFSEQGQAIYDELKDNPNLFLMLSGHGGAADHQTRRTDTFDGNTIHNVQSNYHFGEFCPFLCGNGFLKILTFNPANDRIDVQTYSTWLDEYKTNDHSQFVLDYDMNGGLHFREIGSVQDVPSGLSPCVMWSDLKPGAAYEWFVEVSDATDTTTGPRWTFTSDGVCAVVEDCDDGDPCTTDDCVATSCTHDAIPLCCVDAAQCNDGNPCTDDTCLSGSCSHSDNSDWCFDGDPCTKNDFCQQGSCAGSPIDCSDGNACTQNACVDGECQAVYTPLPACCSVDDDCHDDDPCTSDSCDVGNTCRNDVIGDCCVDIADCSDADPCTVDICAPRNRGALSLDSPYDKMMVARRGFGGSTSEYPGLNASRFTVECWFRWTGGGSPAATSGYNWSGHDDLGGIEAYPLVSKGIVGAEYHPDREWMQGKMSVNYFLGILETGHVLAADFERYLPIGNTSPNYPVIGTTTIESGVWHHAAATYDGSCWQLYLDGLPETDGTNCPMQRPADGSWQFFAVGVGGGWEGAVMGNFEGLIDEVRVWNRGLSQAEIQAQMYSHVPTHPDLIGRWSFDDPIQEAIDTTGNENHGAISGAEVETVGLVDLGGNDCVSRSPGEITRLTLNPGINCDFVSCDFPPTSTKLRWVETAPGGLRFDVASGLLGDLQADGSTDLGECVTNNTVSPYYHDRRPDPAAGQGLYYMVREDGSCEAGSYGHSSTGEERLPQAACP